MKFSLDPAQAASAAQFDRQSDRYGKSHILADTQDVAAGLEGIRPATPAPGRGRSTSPLPKGRRRRPGWARGYSTFCTCSRTRSTSSFSATTSCTTAALAALLPMVFTSRAISWARKSRRLPQGPVASIAGARLGDVAAQALHLLRDVVPLHGPRDLLVQPRVVEAHLRGQPADLLDQGLAARRLAVLGQRPPRRAAPASMRASARRARCEGRALRVAHRRDPGRAPPGRRGPPPRGASLTSAAASSTSIAPGKRATSATVTSPARPCSRWRPRSAATTPPARGARPPRGARVLGEHACTETSTRPRPTRAWTARLTSASSGCSRRGRWMLSVEEAMVDGADRHRAAHGGGGDGRAAVSGHGADHRAARSYRGVLGRELQLVEPACTRPSGASAAPRGCRSPSPRRRR